MHFRAVLLALMNGHTKSKRRHGEFLATSPLIIIQARDLDRWTDGGNRFAYEPDLAAPATTIYARDVEWQLYEALVPQPKAVRYQVLDHGNRTRQKKLLLLEVLIIRVTQIKHLNFP